MRVHRFLWAIFGHNTVTGKSTILSTHSDFREARKRFKSWEKDCPTWIDRLAIEMFIRNPPLGSKAKRFVRDSSPGPTL